MGEVPWTSIEAWFADYPNPCSPYRLGGLSPLVRSARSPCYRKPQSLCIRTVDRNGEMATSFAERPTLWYQRDWAPTLSPPSHFWSPERLTMRVA